jgi:hypothetical protein
MKKISLVFIALSVCMGLSTVAAAEYSGGVFTTYDTDGLYELRLTFDTTQEYPHGHELRQEVDDSGQYKMDMNWFAVEAPVRTAAATWSLSGDLFGSGGSLSVSNHLWDWSSRTGITANPFPMETGRYYRLTFTVNDPSRVSGLRTVYFYFALEQKQGQKEAVKFLFPPYIDDPFIIPPDERFPATFKFSLVTADRQMVLFDEPVTVSMVDNTQNGYLQGGGMTGSSVRITTDAATPGEAQFSYRYRGTPPQDGYEFIPINITAENYEFTETVTIQVGLKIQIDGLGEAWDGRTETPRVLGLRLQLSDAFETTADLEKRMETYRDNYITGLFTDGYPALALKMKWLNEPSRTFMNDARRLMTAYPYNPFVGMYEGCGWYKQIDDHTFMRSLNWDRNNESNPQRFMGGSSDPYYVPAILFKSQGLHVFELSLYPYLLEDKNMDGPNHTYGLDDLTAETVVASAPFPPAYVCADVYGAENAFKSAVCSFEPTNAQQFLLKTIFLDCPLLEAVPYAQAILAVQDVAGAICDFMNGDVLKIASSLGDKFLGRLEELNKEGLLQLTAGELELFKKKAWVDSLKKVSDAVWNARKHFTQNPGLAFGGTIAGPSAVPAFDAGEEEWPDNLTLNAMLDAFHNWSAGLFMNSEFAGREAVVVMGEGASATALPQDIVSYEDDAVSVYLFPESGGALTLSTDQEVRVMTVRGISATAVQINEYALNSSNQTVLVTVQAGSDSVSIDSDGDGTADETVAADTSTYGDVSSQPIQYEVSLDPSDWIQKDNYSGAFRSSDDGLMVSGGSWTNGQCKPNCDGNHLLSRNSYNLTNGADVRVRFQASGAGTYMAMYPEFLDTVYSHYVTTHHSWSGSVVIPEDTDLYSHISVDPDKTWTFDLCTGGYADRGGTLLDSASGTFSDAAWSNAAHSQLRIVMTDNYGGTSAYVLVKEALVTVSNPGDTGSGCTLGGTVTYDGSPVNAMVLANGKYMFTSGGAGRFVLSNVPFDSKGEITLYAFCSGLTPYKTVLTAGVSGFSIELSADSEAKQPLVTIDSMTDSVSRPGWIDLTGTIENDSGIPLCAMVLANGQYMFTCNPVGEFSLTVPPDGNGNITIYGFCSGLTPYRSIVAAPNIN